MTGNFTCPYCSSLTLRMTGRELHPARPDLINKHYHVCRACDAWAVCSDGTWDPIGPLANAELRRARQDAHSSLEGIWSNAAKDHQWSTSKARNLTYIWMSDEMSIDQKDLQIGRFGLEQCNLLILIAKHREPDLASISQERVRAAARAKFGSRFKKAWPSSRSKISKRIAS